MHCVDLGESFQISIYYLLANFGFDTASRTSPVKFARALRVQIPHDRLEWGLPRWAAGAGVAPLARRLRLDRKFRLRTRT